MAKRKPMLKKQNKIIKEEIENWIRNESFKIVLSDSRTVKKATTQIQEIVEKVLQRFIEETRIEKITAQNDRLGLKSKNNYKDGFNEALDEIKEKQQRWLRENL
ncbi:MAG: hypothetical protein J7L39_03195 [Candidatus Aenigmarchaeota archaeon]|nr:hypothetical protein [Candidatus Aenigmarchaeota archaeon]